MILLNCPNCGKRNISEFRYGGELNIRPESGKTTPSQWNSYLYIRDNILGSQKEWWFHRQGCMRWFIAERHTKTHEVYRTYFWTRQGQD
jgi:sarcosine oxidase subunit delta